MSSNFKEQLAGLVEKWRGEAEEHTLLITKAILRNKANELDAILATMTEQQPGLVDDLDLIWNSVSDDRETNAAYQRLRSFLATLPEPRVVSDEAHCATCTCVPGMTPAVRFDASPAEREGAVREHLISMGWTPPGAAAPAGEVGFKAWLVEQMPTGTVIGNPEWWAERIARAYELNIPQPTLPAQGFDAEVAEAVRADEAAWELAERAEAVGAERDSDDNETWWVLRIEQFRALAAAAKKEGE